MPRLVRQITSFTSKELRALFKKARIVCRHTGLDIKQAPSSGEIGKIVVITPRKIGSAPVRNKIRRQLKSIFYQDKLYLHKTDIVIYCKKDSADLSYATLKELLYNALTQATC